MRPIDPVTITSIEGKEYQFLLSMGGIRRLKKALKVSNLAEILAFDAEAAGIPILYEALLEKGNMTEDQFADTLRADLNQIITTVTALLGVSMPDPRPTEASTPTIQ